MPLELQLDLSLRLIVAAVLSALVGYNRERHAHPAGLRTHIQIGIGSALFTGLSMFAFERADQARVAAQILTGIGFLGAGAIVQGRKPYNVYGLTTAAGIWAVAAIGMACGSGNYVVAAFGAVLIWFVLAVMQRMEQGGKRPDSSEIVPSSEPRNFTTATPRTRGDSASQVE
jgi:putative Mg2+ transporter-C (MgtC) family protein